MAKFSNVQVGDRVWSSKYGAGYVKWIVESHKYPLRVMFYNNRYTFFTYDGYEDENDVYPTLFWNEFHIPIDEEDKKPFNLVEFLKSNLQPTEFVLGNNNLYFSYNNERKEWCTCINTIFENINVYFKPLSDKRLYDTLNQNQITPQQLKQAYKELGWL